MNRVGLFDEGGGSVADSAVGSLWRVHVDRYSSMAWGKGGNN